MAVTVDVTRPEQVQALVDTAVKTYGRIDVMINNGGLMPHSPLERRKIDDWNRMIDVNIKGVLYGIAAGIRDYYAKFAIPAKSFAQDVAYALNQPAEVDINEILFRPTAQEL